jgi:hypothetical protein
MKRWQTMRRLIDADILFDAMEETEWYNNADRDEIAERLIMDAPTIKTKQIKYYDEDESVWKIGEVIVNSSEKPNNSND